VLLTAAAYILMQELRLRAAGKLRRQKLSLPLFANATCPVVKLMNRSCLLYTGATVIVGYILPLAITLSAYKPREDNRETRSGADRY
jgi:hypothetical protein